MFSSFPEGLEDSGIISDLPKMVEDSRYRRVRFLLHSSLKLRHMVRSSKYYRILAVSLMIQTAVDDSVCLS